MCDSYAAILRMNKLQKVMASGAIFYDRQIFARNSATQCNGSILSKHCHSPTNQEMS